MMAGTSFSLGYGYADLFKPIITEALSQQAGRVVASPGAEEIVDGLLDRAIQMIEDHPQVYLWSGHRVPTALLMLAFAHDYAASLEARHRTLLDNYDKMEAERDRLREIVRIGVEECGNAKSRADSLSLLLREVPTWIPVSERLPIEGRNGARPL